MLPRHVLYTDQATDDTRGEALFIMNHTGMKPQTECTHVESREADHSDGRSDEYIYLLVLDKF